jgi:hypothetical protein
MENEMKTLCKLPLVLPITVLLATATLASAPQQAGPPAPIASVQNGTLIDAAKKGIPLSVTSVSNSASIQAVLIPADLARRIFGKEISKNYAVVEVIISNTDANATLIVHSIFLDDSDWLLRGISGDCEKGNQTPARLTAAQKSNLPCQVASIESRLVRGELLDAQPGTARNWTMRSLVAVGSLAAGFAFPFSSDVVKGISSFNGVLVPGAATLWPDGTISQINHISDFGFQTNKVIPKQGSDIIVAFFPIDRFLTPSFRSLFLKDPAALFVPGEMVADPKTEAVLEDFLGPIADTNSDLGSTANSHRAETVGSRQAFRKKMLTAVIQDCSGDKSSLDACKLQALLNAISMNNIRVVVEGAMTVDVTTIPATIYSVDFDKGDANTIWTTIGQQQTGIIAGVYLSGGTPSVVDQKGTEIDGVSIEPVPENSSDSLMHFTMKISKCVSSDQKVFFVVNKPQGSSSTNATSNPPVAPKQAKLVSSVPFQIQQQPSTPCTTASDSPAAATPTDTTKPASAPPQKNEKGSPK